VHIVLIKQIYLLKKKLLHIEVNVPALGQTARALAAFVSLGREGVEVSTSVVM
jgi:hypothetical protein